MFPATTRKRSRGEQGRFREKSLGEAEAIYQPASTAAGWTFLLIWESKGVRRLCLRAGFACPSGVEQAEKRQVGTGRNGLQSASSLAVAAQL